MVPWMGGKLRLVPQILALLPHHHTYVEVFGGSGAVLLNKAPSPVEIWNDLDGELVNLFMTVRDHPAEFIRHVRSLPYARTLRQAWRTQFYGGAWPKDRFERAVRYYYLVRSSFFGHIDKGWRFALKTDEATRMYNCVGEVEQIAQRLIGVQIDHKDFQECIRCYDRANVAMYCDPPYYGAVPYRKKIPPFTEQCHLDLARILAKLRCKWLLTYNDHPRIRELYKGFKTTEVATRLNTDKMATANRRLQRQLIIRNYG